MQAQKTKFTSNIMSARWNAQKSTEDLCNRGDSDDNKPWASSNFCLQGVYCFAGDVYTMRMAHWSRDHIWFDYTGVRWQLSMFAGFKNVKSLGKQEYKLSNMCIDYLIWDDIKYLKEWLCLSCLITSATSTNVS